jgi:hypothetical protein
VSEQTSVAVARWADEIAALGGSEPLTRYRDLKTGTLDLQGADAEARKRLLDGEPVRVSRLFPHDPIRTSAARSARRLAQRLTALRDGHGLAAGNLAIGLASWNDRMSARRPMAPVLLRRLETLAPAFAEDDVLLHVVGEPELNPLLLEAMAEQLGIRLTPDDLLDPGGELRYPVVVDRLREQAPPHIVDGFTISHRAVVTAMSDVPEVVAAELRANARAFAEAPFVALAAGSPLERVQAGPVAEEAHTGVGRSDEAAPPLDLDAAQAAVLAAVRDGRSVTVDAPVGTGAVQVTAALCADAVVRGRTVLVVAEGAPRLHELARRLGEVGLGGAALDLADGLVSAPRLARDLLVTLEAGSPRGGRRAPADGNTPDPSRSRATEDEALLRGSYAALHHVREPWGMSAAEAISAAAAGAGLVPERVRIASEDLVQLDAARLAALRGDLAEFVELEGLRIAPSTTAWFGARPVTAADAEAAVDAVERLRSSLLPAVRDLSARAAAEVGMPAPTGPAQAQDLADLLEGVAAVERALSSEVWGAPVDRLAAATADRRGRRELAETPGFRERRHLRAQAASLARDAALAADPARLSAALRQADDLQRRWSDRCRDSRRPRLGESAPEFVAALRRERETSDGLVTLHPDALDRDADFAATAARLARLADEATWVRRLPSLNADAARLADAGLGPVVAALRGDVERGRRVDGAAAVAALDACVATSVAEQILATDPVLSAGDGNELREAADRWRRADAAATVAQAHHARAAWLERVQRAATERPVQLRSLRDAAEGRAPRTARELLAVAGDTAWAARPVWLAGPLAAAAALPLRMSVDLLVVLDAQAAALAHAIGVLGRARQVAVLGDPQLPPPAPTPVSVEAPDPRATAPLPGAVVETPSVFALLRDQLEHHDLSVRYGCRDERLHALMPVARPPRPLSVPPGPWATSPVRFVRVDQQPGSRDQEESVVPEVAAVVELVREHVREQPGRSLAVLTLGAAHAEAVRVALARACLGDPALAAGLGPDADEPFLVAHVDELRGERRDSVVLSVGFGRTVDGRLLYRFGPLNRPGGLRWLAAAVAVAQRSLTVVSSVGADDLEPRRLAADGLRGLREMLAVAEGVLLEGIEASAGGEPGLHEDALLDDVRGRLHAAGLPVVGGGGSGTLAVPVVLAHARRPDRGVLAVDDDALWSEVASVRDRERMRPEALQRAGWATHRVSAAAWLRYPEREVEAVRAAWAAAQQQADAADAARHAPSLGTDEGGAETDPADPADPADPVAPVAPVDVRPDVPAGRPVAAYSPADLVALAAWVEQGHPGQGEDAVVAALAAEVGLGHPDTQGDLALREAVRTAVVLARGPVPLGHPAADASGSAHEPGLPLAVAADHESLDAEERAREQAGEAEEREAWLTEQRPPHHE